MIKSLHINLFVLFLLTAVVLSTGCFNQEDESNKPPVAKATANPSTVEIHGTVQFSARGSYDPDGDSLTYHWDFDASNGANDVDSIEMEPTHVYNDVGVYTVTLTVSDGEYSDKTQIEVKVVKPEGRLVAVITTEDETKGTVHETESEPGAVHEDTITIEFSGEESEDTDPNSEIEKYEWDYIYEGSFEADESGVTGSYAYKSGRYAVVLRVTNTTGSTDEDTMLITINYNQTYKNRSLEAGENESYRFPVNTAGALRMDIRLSYKVNNVGSWDEDDLELYLYDVDGNKIADTESQENGSERITLSTAEIYQNGQEASIGKWKVVVENQNDFVTVDNYKLSIDVMYYFPS
ncbi:MAG TPA: PKD domain-containing protein [Thermoplasmata archaeon]|nr:PKD domain-containing protein [Thermoplasmata archaeon]